MEKRLFLNLRRVVTTAFLITFFATIPFFYQNCASPLEDASRDLSSVAESAPFAYETQMDHIAYMSCSNMPAGYDTNTFFTFKMGAYESGGVKLTPGFLNATRNLTATDKAAALAQSRASGDVFISLGVRDHQNLQSLANFGNIFAADFVGALSTSTNANALISNSGKSYLKSLPSGNIEDTVHFTNSEGNASALRTLLISGAYLTQSYNKAGADPSIALGGTGPKALGRGYKMDFALGFGQSSSFNSGLNAPFRVLTNLREYDLLTGEQTSAAWDCDPKWRFMILRPFVNATNPGDVGVNALCENHTVEPVPSAADQEMYTILRRMLPATDWGVNLSRRCIVPKKAGLCYGNSTPIKINFDGGTCNTNTGNCPHYVSICKRR